MRRPPPPKPAPRAPDKPFEIRRGRRSSDDEESPEGEEAIGQVVLPRSITQEAEEDSLKRRFGSESLPDITGKAPILQVAQSVGEAGPDRARRGMKVGLVLFLLLLAGAAAWWFTRTP